MTLLYCITAIKYNADNVKAYYRKASALKSMKMFAAALQSAEQGRRQAAHKRQEVSVTLHYTMHNVDF